MFASQLGLSEWGGGGGKVMQAIHIQKAKSDNSYSVNMDYSPCCKKYTSPFSCQACANELHITNMTWVWCSLINLSYYMNLNAKGVRIAQTDLFAALWHVLNMKHMTDWFMLQVAPPYIQFVGGVKVKMSASGEAKCSTSRMRMIHALTSSQSDW